MSVEDYHKGFKDGMSVDKKYPQNLSIMGYTLEQIMKLINNDLQTKFRSDVEYIKQMGTNKMATMLIDKSDLNLLFPNEKQREVFLRIMNDLVSVKNV